MVSTLLPLLGLLLVAVVVVALIAPRDSVAFLALFLWNLGHAVELAWLATEPELRRPCIATSALTFVASAAILLYAFTRTLPLLAIATAMLVASLPLALQAYLRVKRLHRELSCENATELVQHLYARCIEWCRKRAENVGECEDRCFDACELLSEALCPSDEANGVAPATRGAQRF